jgi:hypothetical protein
MSLHFKSYNIWGKKNQNHLYTVADQNQRVRRGPPFRYATAKNKENTLLTNRPLGGVWEQSFSAVLKQYYSIEQYCGIIYFEVFDNSSEISVY